MNLVLSTQACTDWPFGGTVLFHRSYQLAFLYSCQVDLHIISHQYSVVQKVRERWREGEGGFKERKKKSRTCTPLPSPQIRDTLEVTEMEWSNPLGPTSKAAGFRVKIRTTVKDSELPKLSATSGTLSPHLRKQREDRGHLKGNCDWSNIKRTCDY